MKSGRQNECRVGQLQKRGGGVGMHTCGIEKRAKKGLIRESLKTRVAKYFFKRLVD